MCRGDLTSLRHVTASNGVRRVRGWRLIMSLSNSLQKLASYRSNSSRESQNVFKIGSELLKTGNAPRDEEGIADRLRTRYSLLTVRVQDGPF